MIMDKVPLRSSIVPSSGACSLWWGFESLPSESSVVTTNSGIWFSWFMLSSISTTFYHSIFIGRWKYTHINNNVKYGINSISILWYKICLCNNHYDSLKLLIYLRRTKPFSIYNSFLLLKYIFTLQVVEILYFLHLRTYYSTRGTIPQKKIRLLTNLHVNIRKLSKVIKLKKV